MIDDKNRSNKLPQFTIKWDQNIIVVNRKKYGKAIDNPMLATDMLS